MITADQLDRPLHDLRVDPLAGRRGQQLGVGQLGHLAAGPAGQHDRGHDERAGAGAAAGLVGAGDRRQAGAGERPLVGVEAALAAYDEPWQRSQGAGREPRGSRRRLLMGTSVRLVTMPGRSSLACRNVAGCCSQPARLERPDAGERAADDVGDRHEATTRVARGGSGCPRTPSGGHPSPRAGPAAPAR